PQGSGPGTRAVALCPRLMDGPSVVSLPFLPGPPALDLLVASGFDALTMPPAPAWPAKDGVLRPAWRWYRDYGRYLRIARRFPRREADWSYYRFLISDSELASVRQAIRPRVPTALSLDCTRHNFARAPIS